MKCQSAPRALLAPRRPLSPFCSNCARASRSRLNRNPRARFNFSRSASPIAPQKFVNKEIGVKWNILPRLLFSAAVYKLIRTNVPLPDPNNPGFFILSGSNTMHGLETELKGYMTDKWQSWLGYAYTDARVSGDTAPTIKIGNRIQLVPYHQFSWWNKYQITPVWAVSLGAIYFSDSYTSSDDTVYL